MHWTNVVKEPQTRRISALEANDWDPVLQWWEPAERPTLTWGSGVSPRTMSPPEDTLSLREVIEAALLPSTGIYLVCTGLATLVIFGQSPF